VKQFAEWLSTTFLSVFIQNHQSWAVPTIQSIHIVGICMAVGSVFMINLRILGLAAADQTLRQTQDRFGPWVKGSLYLLLTTGALLVIAEPVRELVTFSFWLKMFLVLVGVLTTVAFQNSLRKNEQHWEETLLHRAPVRWLAIFTLLIWVSIIFLGRLIAYDHIWGSWSPATKASAGRSPSSHG